MDISRKFSDPVLNTKILPVCGILVVKGKNTAMTGGVFAGKVKKKEQNPNYFSSDFAESVTSQQYGCRRFQICTQNQIEAQRSGFDWEAKNNPVRQRSLAAKRGFVP